MSLKAAQQPGTAARILKQAHRASGISLRELARRAGTSHATLSAYLKSRKVPSVETLERIVDACDLALDWDLRPRIRRRNGIERGQELVEVLRLAEQFPVRTRRKSKMPIFPNGSNG